MIKIQESFTYDKRLENIFYRPEHKRKEFFYQEHETEIEKAFEEYLAGSVPSFDMDPFEKDVAEDLKRYIRNAPGYPNMLFRLENKVPRNEDLKKNDVIYFRISSWSKSYTAIKEMIEHENEDVVIFVSKNLTAINVEGYSGFYEQRESLTYGSFSVMSVKLLNIANQKVKCYEVMQIGF